MLIWTNCLFNRGCASFFVKTKGCRTSFQVEVFVEFFDNFFLSKTYFLFYARAFDDIMKYEYLKF